AARLGAPASPDARRRRRGEAATTAVLFYPAFALVAAVSFFPLFYAVRQSLHRADYLELGAFVGLRNFVILFTTGGGPHFLSVSLLFVAGTLVLTVPLGMGLALLLARPIRFRTGFRTVLAFPWVVSELVTGYLWMWFYDGRLGPMADLLARFGLAHPLTDPRTALAGVVVANSWHAYPLVMIFTLAALQTVPADVQEAARLDTRTEWQRFRYVTLPLIRSSVLVALVLTTLRSFNNVTLVIAMTGGGPVGATDVLGMRVFSEAFQFYRMDVASALAVVIFCLNMLASAAFIRVLRGQPE
ncbi:MAG TPA: sugar ABC transporter permease, partial [Acetobacteraceae bacterium]